MSPAMRSGTCKFDCHRKHVQLYLKSLENKEVNYKVWAVFRAIFEIILPLQMY